MFQSVFLVELELTTVKIFWLLTLKGFIDACTLGALVALTFSVLWLTEFFWKRTERQRVYCMTHGIDKMCRRVTSVPKLFMDFEACLFSGCPLLVPNAYVIIHFK